MQYQHRRCAGWSVIAPIKRDIQIIVLFLHKNICLGSLEAPQRFYHGERGASNETQRIDFCVEIRKISTHFGWQKPLIWTYGLGLCRLKSQRLLFILFDLCNTSIPYNKTTNNTLGHEKKSAFSYIWATPNNTVPSNMCKMHRLRSSCACAKYAGLCSPFIFLQYWMTVSRQWRPWSDRADPQADLVLHVRICRRYILHGAAHIIPRQRLKQNKKQLE